MNTIWELAFLSTSGKRREALFASALAVLEHRTIPIRLPFGGSIELPLTLERSDNFNARLASLPVHVYSPDVNDRDKLQHFFFSAYLSDELRMPWMTNAIGALVEIGEDLFVIGGANDPRDKHANADGIRFARRLRSRPDALPASSLTPNP